MKRITSFRILWALLLGLAACGQAQKRQPDPGGHAQATAEPILRLPRRSEQEA